MTWLKLTQRPDAVNGLMNVRSLNSLVTDSAAAASAWGSGSRVVNGAVLESGPPETIRASRTVQEAYLGEGVAA